MKIMQRLTWRSLWLNKTRTVVTLVGIALSAALFMSVTTAAYSLWHFIVRGYEYEIGDFFVSFDRAAQAQYAAAQEDKAVKSVADLKILGYTNQFDYFSPVSTYEIGAMGENFLKQMPVPLVEGRLPENSGEILIPDLYIFNCRAENLDAPNVGDVLRFSVIFSIGADRESGTDAPREPESREYTVVGIMESRTYHSGWGEPGYPTMLTVADGSEGTALWHRLFLKTSPFRAVALSQENYGKAELHTELLTAYGFTTQQNTTLMILLMAVVLLVIVMVASCCLITNAFSISVAERTKQFGLLSSVGATRKQIRSSVRFEAFTLMGLSIPVGLLTGYAAVALVFRFYGEHLARLFTFSVNGSVVPRAELSAAAVLAAVLVCALTARIAAQEPAERAAAVTPLEAIRQNRDYGGSAGKASVDPVTEKLLGVPGVIGARYYRASRRKYRAVVSTLAFSMVLFVCAAYFCDRQEMLADAQGAEYFDFRVYSCEDRWQETYQQLRTGAAIEQSALTDRTSFMTGFIRPEDLHEDYKKLQEVYPGREPDYSAQRNEEWITLYYLEDQVLAAHLEAEGIDPAPYFEEGRILGATVQQALGGFVVENEAGEWVKQKFYGYILPENTGTVICPPQFYPTELAQLPSGAQDSSGVFQPMETHKRFYQDGKIILQVGGQFFWEEITDETVDGKQVIRYYRYNNTTGQADREAVLTTTDHAPTIAIGARLETLPYGVSTDSGDILLLLPLSKRLSQELPPKLCLDTRDYQTTLHELEACGKGNLEFSFEDFNERKMNTRGIVTLVRAFSTGFTLLIGLIACANVVNTITTNVALRRRDYGMLRSMGFTQGDLHRMMVSECVRYSINAIVWSGFLSIALCYGIYRISRLGYITDFCMPWDMFALGICLVITVLFASAAYAIFTVRKDNPIDAIRMENT